MTGGARTKDVAKLQASAEGLGITLPPKMLEPEEPQHYEVWPENWRAVDLFLRCQTQWRLSINGRAGLDYPAVLEVGRLYSVDDLPRTLEDLQVMELAILKAGGPG